MMSTEVFVFARFHALEGRQGALADLLREEVRAARADAGCVAHAAYRSLRDPLLFWIHSRWRDEAAFDAHAEMPHTVRFIEKIESLIDHPLDVTRTHALV